MAEYLIQNGDVREVLAGWDDGVFNCCITSPPYWGLRSYSTNPQIWGGTPECRHCWSSSSRKPQSGGTGAASAKQKTSKGTQGKVQTVIDLADCTECGAWRGELGMEPTPQMFVDHLVLVFREVKRVLRNDGTLWLNLGDSYATNNPVGNRTGMGGSGLNCFRDGYVPPVHRKDKAAGDGAVSGKRSLGGMKPKDLIGIPWRAALALQADGWYLRSDIIWSKTNPMPESVTDRPTKAHEYVFLLSKSATYYYDHESVKEPVASVARSGKGRSAGNKSHKYTAAYESSDSEEHRTKAGLLKSADKVYETRNMRSVWTITSQPYKGAHFATFPEKLVEPCVLAGCPDDGWVLEPFCGSGTTLKVANDNGRNAVGIELNPEYCELAEARVGGSRG